MSMIYCHKHDVHYDSDFEEDCPECIEEEVDTIQITITTPNHQIRTFKGTPEALALNDWNKIMEGIINSEAEYERD